MSMKPYPEYKDSGFNWLGDIPSTWSVFPLWYLFKRTKRLGTGKEVLLSVYRDYGVIPKSSRDDNFNKASEDLSKYQVVEVGDLVINKMKAWQGSVAVSEHNGIVSPAYFVFRGQETTDLKFMHYLMRSIPYFQHYASISSGVRPNQWDLDPDRHRIMPVLVPSLTEQNSIAAYLDRETAEIDAFIADQEELIKLLSERRTATITRAVVKGLAPETEMKDSKIDWLGKIPVSWRILPLRYLIDEPLKYGANEPADSADPTEIRYLRITDFDLLGRLRQETFRSLPYAVAAPYMVSPGDVLFARSGATVGKAFIVPEDAPPSCFAGYLIKARVARTRMLPEFLFSYTQSSVFDTWKNLTMVQATIQNIGADKYATLPIPVPPLGEQKKIMAYITAELREIDAAIADAQKAIALSKERRAAVISAAVTGKIDVRGLVASTADVVEGASVGAA